jgi:hypothetical protein
VYLENTVKVFLHGKYVSVYKQSPYTESIFTGLAKMFQLKEINGATILQTWADSSRLFTSSLLYNDP